jgi:large subunit ribosomal protein L22
MAVAEQQEREMVHAQARYVHSSARKARLVTDLIRGRSVPEARTILAFSNRAVAKDVEKVLRSAVANAESRPDLHWAGDELVVAAAYADEGPTLKRWRARARGRVARIRKRTCHITIELAQGAPAAGIPSMPAMAAPEPTPIEEPEALEEPETVDEAEVEDTDTAEEPAAETETDEPEAEAETPEESPSPEAEAQASTEETDR